MTEIKLILNSIRLKIHNDIDFAKSGMLNDSMKDYYRGNLNALKGIMEFIDKEFREQEK